MDRFIEELHKVITLNTKNLKSNMDRFIDCLFVHHDLNPVLFKIQYG